MIGQPRITANLCTDEIDVQFLQDVANTLKTNDADLLVIESTRITEDVALTLEERIARLDQLVDQAHTLLRKSGFDSVWGDNHYTISPASDRS